MKHPFTIYLLLAATLAQGLAARGQLPVFGVYSAAGNIKCIPARGPSRPVFPLTWLYEGDKVTLLDNISEITVFDHETLLANISELPVVDRDTGYARRHDKSAYTIGESEKTHPARVWDTMIIR